MVEELSQPDNDNRLLKDETIVACVPHEVDYLDVKWTYDQYLEELKKPIEPPDSEDPDHPGYYKKYAHNLPPNEAYFLIPDRHCEVAQNEATKNNRRVYFGWNNVTDFELRGVRALQQFIRKKGIEVMPPGFAERDWLKWI